MNEHEPRAKPAAAEPDCEDSLWRVELPALEGPERATLILDHSPETAEFFRPGREPAGTCVRFGDGAWSLYGEGEGLEIPADEGQLQRWRVGGGELLLRVRPGEELRFDDEEDTIWMLHGPRFDPPTKQRCRDPRDCGVGREARRVDRCLDEASVCVARPRLRLSSPEAAPSQRWPAPARRFEAELRLDELEPGAVRWGASGMRSLIRLRYGDRPREIATLLMGIGERWQLWLAEDGSLDGRALP